MELRQALRSLRNSMGLTVTAALALALGVGVTTTMFSAVDQLLVRALPYPASDRLMMLYQHGDDHPDQSVMLGRSRIADLHRAQEQHVFDAVGVYTGTSPILIGHGDATRVNGSRVDAEFFRAMRVRPAIGRLPAIDEFRPGASPVIVLSDALWRTRLGADHEVIGSRITLDTTSYQVIGVMPAAFNFPMKAAFWIPMSGIPTAAQCVQCAWAVARLADGVSVETARSRMRELAATDREIDASLPPFMRSMYGDMTSIRDWTTREARTELLVLFGAVCCVLLIACANVANLLLSRSLARRREFAVRTALGASRARIIRQVLLEAALLAVPAALAGSLLAGWGVRLLGVFIPRWSLIESITVDTRVLVFAVSASLIAAFISALWPAVRASSVAASSTLREQRASGSMTRNRFRSAMVVIQVAMSFVLVTAAFLLTKSFLRLVSTDTGFQPQRLVAMTIQLSGALYPKPAQRIAFREQLEQRVRGLPGTNAFAVTTAVPFAGTGMLTEFANAADTSRVVFGPAVNTTDGLFNVLGTRMLAGRNFIRGDSGVVILNRTAATQLFPDGNAVGQRVTMFGEASTIVGIVGDMRSQDRAAPPMPQVFSSLAGVSAGYLLVVVRTTGDPAAVMSAQRGIVHAMDPRQPIERLATMDALLSDSVKQPRTQTLLLVVFGGLAFLMACLGLYGVVSYSVVQRTHEIGVRVALGAQRASVMTLVLRQGLALAAAGAAIGIVVALWATRFIAASLYEVKPLDPTVFVSTAAGLLGVAVLASFLPARRATRIDPMIALRAE